METRGKAMGRMPDSNLGRQSPSCFTFLCSFPQFPDANNGTEPHD